MVQDFLHPKKLRTLPQTWEHGQGTGEVFRIVIEGLGPRARSLEFRASSGCTWTLDVISFGGVSHKYVGQNQKREGHPGSSGIADLSFQVL